MTEVPDPPDEGVTTITEGSFEETYRIDAESAGDFLVQLGEQLRADDELVVSGDGWEIPFPFEEPVTLEVEFDGDGNPELDVELELAAQRR
ncbi:amphi-Trp domain-containing protein [Halobacteriales archaeon QS_8_69_26]|nr:MAG: amphi-Trp domain-containing protein [Halobacteriales archaeon QS_8_69_26]